MFNAFIAFLSGQTHVRDLHVILIIQPGFHAQFRASTLRHQPHSLHGALYVTLTFWYHAGVGLTACGFCRGNTRLMGICQDIAKTQRPTCAARGGHKGFAIMAGWCAIRIWAEVRLRLIPDQLAAAMGPEVYNRRPAARHGHRVAGDFLQRCAFTCLRTDRNTGHTLAAFDFCDAFAKLNTDPHAFGFGHQCAAAIGPRIKDHRHIKARFLQRDCRAIGIVIVGHNNRAIPGGDPEVLGIVAHSGGQHHTWNIVASKGQRALNRTRGGHDLFGANTPQAMTRTIGERRVICHTLIAQHIAMVINASPHHAVAQRDILHAFKLCHSRRNILGHRRAFDGAAIHRSAATPMGGLLHQQNLGTGLCRSLGRLQARDTAAHNNHVKEGIEMLITICIAVFGCFAQTSRLAHNRLKHMFPRRCGRHEGLVVKPCRQEARRIVVHHTHIEFQRRPVVL
ncbi:hypothetical protein SHM7688_01428 [Shimia marina]|uniref:Uncharacterized protein n=1 Tax=Shimia marina TaxID=321267 RepID=A0A0N7LRW9_9RHOB|nr:hypothetical protein SHM7688_01428 [Shimia marina]